MMHQKPAAARGTRQSSIPLWRRWLGLAALLLLLGGYGGYLHLTADRRVQRKAERFLRQFTDGDVWIGSARFRLFGNIELADVRVALPPTSRFAAAGQSPQRRQIFRARRVRLHHVPWSLLGGSLRVERIEAERPVLTIVRRAEDGRYNWQELFGGIGGSAAGGGPLPTIRVHEATVRLVSLRGRQRQVEAVIRLNALASVQPNRPGVYVANVRMLAPRPGPARAVINLLTGGYSIQQAELGIETVRPVLPAQYERWCQILGLTGQIRAEDVRYHPAGASQYQIQLTNASLSIPLSESEYYGQRARSRRLLRLSGVDGSLVFTRRRIRFDLTGLLNGSPSAVSGWISDYSGPLAAIGMDVRIRCQGLMLPARPTARQMLQIARLGRAVAAFIRDFDPSGPINLDLHVGKEPGIKNRPIVRGVIEAVGCTASFRGFPYRCHDIRGRVRLAADGIWLDDLRARHGPATIRINGKIDQARRFTAVRLDIAAYCVPLDDALYQALSRRYRRLWRRFNPMGLINAHLQLQRARGSEQQGPQPWRTSGQIELLDVAARFELFPYPLRHVTGRLSLQPDRIRIDHLAGTNGSTSVVLSGWARLDEFDQQLAVRIQAGSLRLDSALLRALPAGARKSVRQYGLTGRCDLSGWIYLPPSRRELRYDMLAHIADGAMKPAGLAYPIKALGGWLQVRPGRVDILQLTGRGGDGEIAVDGSVRLTDGQGRADLSVHCRGLLLDEPLRAALPGRLQHVWDQLQPRGRINAFLRSQDRPDGRTWQASIELLDARLCYRKFPLPLEQVQGQVKLTARRAQLRRLQARCGQGRVWLDGTIESGPPLRANLQVRAEGMAFDEPLRRALPARFRRAWTAMRPTGRFDLSLARLGCSAEPDGAARWDYRGWLRLRDAGLELGFGLSGVDGVIVAAGQGGPGGRGLSLDGRAEVKRLTINGRVVTELCARLRKASGSDLLRITDVSGRSYGGTVEGFAEVRFGRTEPEYGLSAVLRDVGLGPLLRTRPAGGEGGEDIGGSVTGNIFLTGLAGAAGSRRGGGELQIRRSQLQRLPLVATFLDVANLTAPRGGAFDEADVRFFVQDGRLRFERIDLRGQGLWLAGIGSMRLSDRQLDLRILAARPAGLGRLPLLGELVEGAARELIEVRIGGTLARPRFYVRPLRGVQAAWRSLFGPAPERGLLEQWRR